MGLGNSGIQRRDARGGRQGIENPFSVVSGEPFRPAASQASVDLPPEDDNSWGTVCRELGSDFFAFCKTGCVKFKQLILYIFGKIKSAFLCAKSAISKKNKLYKFTFVSEQSELVKLNEQVPKIIKDKNFRKWMTLLDKGLPLSQQSVRGTSVFDLIQDPSSGWTHSDFRHLLTAFADWVKAADKKGASEKCLPAILGDLSKLLDIRLEEAQEHEKEAQSKQDAIREIFVSIEDQIINLATSAGSDQMRMVFNLGIVFHEIFPKWGEGNCGQCRFLKNFVEALDAKLYQWMKSDTVETVSHAIVLIKDIKSHPCVLDAFLLNKKNNNNNLLPLEPLSKILSELIEKIQDLAETTSAGKILPLLVNLLELLEVSSDDPAPVFQKILSKWDEEKVADLVDSIDWSSLVSPERNAVIKMVKMQENDPSQEPQSIEMQNNFTLHFFKALPKKIKERLEKENKNEFDSVISGLWKFLESFSQGGRSSWSDFCEECLDYLADWLSAGIDEALHLKVKEDPGGWLVYQFLRARGRLVCFLEKGYISGNQEGVQEGVPFSDRFFNHLQEKLFKKVLLKVIMEIKGLSLDRTLELIYAKNSKHHSIVTLSEVAGAIEKNNPGLVLRQQVDRCFSVAFRHLETCIADSDAGAIGLILDRITALEKNHPHLKEVLKTDVDGLFVLAFSRLKASIEEASDEAKVQSILEVAIKYLPACFKDDGVQIEMVDRLYSAATSRYPEILKGRTADDKTFLQKAWDVGNANAVVWLWQYLGPDDAINDCTFGPKYESAEDQLGKDAPYWPQLDRALMGWFATAQKDGDEGRKNIQNGLRFALKVICPKEKMRTGILKGFLEALNNSNKQFEASNGEDALHGLSLPLTRKINDGRVRLEQDVFSSDAPGLSAIACIARLRHKELVLEKGHECLNAGAIFDILREDIATGKEESSLRQGLINFLLLSRRTALERLEVLHTILQTWELPGYTWDRPWIMGDFVNTLLVELQGKSPQVWEELVACMDESDWSFCVDKGWADAVALLVLLAKGELLWDILRKRIAHIQQEQEQLCKVMKENISQFSQRWYHLLRSLCNAVSIEENDSSLKPHACIDLAVQMADAIPEDAYPEGVEEAMEQLYDALDGMANSLNGESPCYAPDDGLPHSLLAFRYIESDNVYHLVVHSSCQSTVLQEGSHFYNKGRLTERRYKISHASTKQEAFAKLGCEETKTTEEPIQEKRSSSPGITSKFANVSKSIVERCRSAFSLSKGDKPEGSSLENTSQSVVASGGGEPGFFGSLFKRKNQ